MRWAKVLVALAAVAAVWMVLAATGALHRDERNAAPSPTVATTDAGQPQATVHDTPMVTPPAPSESASTAPWVVAGRAFLTAYTAAPYGGPAWHTKVARHTTPTLAALLEDVPAGTTPPGPVTAVTVTAVDDLGGGTLTATTKAGTTLVVTVEPSTGSRFVVSAVD